MSEDNNSEKPIKRDPQTGKKRNVESGTFVSEYDDEDFISAVNHFWPDEFPTTKMVADHVGMSRRGALNYLSRLSEEGRLRKKEVSGSNVWIPKND